MCFTGIIEYVNFFERYLSDTFATRLSSADSTMFVALRKWTHIDGCLLRQYRHFISEYVEHVNYL